MDFLLLDRKAGCPRFSSAQTFARQFKTPILSSRRRRLRDPGGTMGGGMLPMRCLPRAANGCCSTTATHGEHPVFCRLLDEHSPYTGLGYGASSAA